MVTFNEIPNGIRTPLVAVEFDASQAQGATPARPFRVLVLGQRLASGGVAALTPTRFTRAEDVAAAFGTGSMLHGMARALFAQDRSIEAIFMALDDPTGGARATGRVEFAVNSPLAGQVVVYVAGRRYSVPTSSTSTASSLAAATASAVNADPDAYVTASATGAICTLTAKHAGVAAGKIDLRLSYFSGEQEPSGVTVTLTAFSGGSGDIDLADVTAVLPDEQYHLMALPYTDSANLALLEVELAERFGPMRAIAGMAVGAVSVPFAAATALGSGRNSPHVSLTHSGGSPSPEWEWAAALAMVTAREAFNDPARPLQTVVLSTILPPVDVDRLSQQERNLLLFDGISTTRVNSGGQVAIERLITTYQQSDQGAADTAYLDASTLFVLDFIRDAIVTTFQTKYPRHKIADDGTRAAPGQSVITPSVARAELVSIARALEARGLVEAVDDFKGDIIVERSTDDPSRLNMFFPPDLVNGLRVVAAQVGFRL